MEGRELTPAERTQVARAMRDEDRARDGLRDVLQRRDALLRTLRWGDANRDEVAPATLRAATCSRYHPGGLGRATLYRAIGEGPGRASDDEPEN